MPLTDLTAFRNVWEQRLDDAKVRQLPDLLEKSQAVLQFTSEHKEVVLLLWPELKLTALFAPQGEGFIILG